MAGGLGRPVGRSMRLISNVASCAFPRDWLDVDDSIELSYTRQVV
jgi:hypothetical protein